MPSREALESSTHGYDHTPPYQQRVLRVLSTAVLERESRQRHSAVQVERAISVGQAVDRAEGYRRFRLDGHAQHYLDQQQAREEAANLCRRFLAGTKS